MDSPPSTAPREGRWTSLWVVALLSFTLQLWLCQGFAGGQLVPMTIDINPSNLWKFQYHFPPAAAFHVYNWLGVADLPPPLNPFSLAAHLPTVVFFTLFAPLMATCALLAMAAFLREFGLSRPAAIFGGVVYAWQGDLLPFVFPAHFPYITTWPFFAIAAWGALRSERTGHWAYALISGAGCGIMVELQPDRGGIASLLIAALFLAPILFRLGNMTVALRQMRHLALCVAVAGAIAFASILALIQGNIEGVKLAGESNRTQTFKFVTQFSLGPAETITYAVPGFFGWHINHADGPYWGEIGETLDWPKGPASTRNMNLAISTTGTVATALGLIGILLLMPGSLLGAARLDGRQRFFGLVLLLIGTIALVLSWGWHTPFYRPLFALPLMDKWRNPLKWLEMTNFALITLSALGAQHLLNSLNDTTPNVATTRRRIGWFITVLGMLLGLSLVASYPYSLYVLPIRLHADGYDPRQIANIMATLHSSLIVAILFLALLGILLLLLWNPGWLRSFTLVNPLLHKCWQASLRTENLPLTLAAGLSLLAAAQLGWVATHFVRSVNLQVTTSSNPLLEELHAQGDRVRVSVATEDPYLDMLLLNQFNAYGISSIDVSAASRIPNDISTFFYGPLQNFQARLWLLTGVKNAVIPQNFMTQLQTHADIVANIDGVDGYTLIPTDSDDIPSHAVVRMRDYFEKATFVPGSEVLTEPKLLQRLKDPAWNPRDTVLLTQPAPQPLPSRTPPASAESITVKVYTPTEIQIEARTPRPGFIVINDKFDPDWEVKVDGRPAPMVKADYMLRAIPISAGTSQITLNYVAHYRVRNHVIGRVTPINFLSDASMLAAWIVAGLALRRRNPRGA